MVDRTLPRGNARRPRRRDPLRKLRADVLLALARESACPVYLVAAIARRCGLSLAQLQRAGLDLVAAGLAKITPTPTGPLMRLTKG